MKRRIQKKILNKRKNLLDAIIQILDDIDPMGLIYSAAKAGFPMEEEYAPEAEDMVARLDIHMTLEDIERELKRIFDHWFHFPDIPGAYYTAAARRTLNAWLVFQKKDAIDYPDDIELPEHLDPIIVEID